MMHERFFDAAKETRLRPEERAAMRRKLLSFAEEHPARVERFFQDARSASLAAKEKESLKGALRSFAAAHPVRQRRSFLSALTHPFGLHTLPATLVLLMFLVAGSGVTAYAAEDSVPGDLLYPLKVDVFEPLVERLRFTPEAKAEWAARRMERRFEEAETLARRSRLTVEHSSQLESRLERHIEQLEERLSFLEEQSDRPATDFLMKRVESALDVHESVLAQLGSGALLPGDIAAFREQIRSARTRFAPWRHEEEEEEDEEEPEEFEEVEDNEEMDDSEDVEDSDDDDNEDEDDEEPSGVRRSRMLESRENARVALDELEDLLDDIPNTVVQEKLEEAEEIFDEADEAFSAGSPEDARLLFDRAREQAMEAFGVLKIMQEQREERQQGEDGTSLESETSILEFFVDEGVQRVKVRTKASSTVHTSTSESETNSVHIEQGTDD